MRKGILLWIDRRFGGEDRWYLRPPKDAGMRVPDQVLKSAVFLGVDTPEGIKFKATGYIVSVGYGHGHVIKQKVNEITHTTRYPLMYLVTAGHAAEELDGFDFFIRANKKDGTLAVIEVDGSTRWWYHPTDRDKVDAAMMVLPVAEVMTLDIKPIPLTMFVNDGMINDRNLGIGDEVFLAGLFTKVQGAEKNIPIVRTGNVAMMPSEPIPFADRFGNERLIHANLIESSSIGGLSGSPVFIRETLRIPIDVQSGTGVFLNVTNDATPESPGSYRLHLSGVGRFFFFGSMVGHWGIPVGFTSSGAEAVNMGIAPMVPAEKIFELVTQPELLKLIEEIRMKQLERENKESGEAVLDSAREMPFTKEDFENVLKKAGRKIEPKPRT